MRGPCTCRGTPAPRSRMLIPSPLERINERDPGPRDLAILHHDNATAYRSVRPVMIGELMSTEGARRRGSGRAPAIERWDRRRGTYSAVSGCNSRRTYGSVRRYGGPVAWI